MHDPAHEAAGLTHDHERQQALTATVVSHRVSAAYVLGDTGAALVDARSLLLPAIPGVGISVIALWPGHEGTETAQVYLHADMAIKERALARVSPTGGKLRHCTAPDNLLAFLKTL